MASLPPLPAGVAEHSDDLASRPRRAVLAGVGEARNNPNAGDELTQPIALAIDAARAALADGAITVGPDAVGLICSTVGSDDSPDPAGALREAMGLTTARTLMANVGVSQQRLVSMALLAVESGRVDVALVFGAEAKASSLHARRNDLTAPATPGGPGADEVLAPEGEFMASAEVSASLWDPVAQYALIDSALARSEDATPQELSREVSELWARFDSVASHNSDALFAGPPHTADDLAMTTQANRLLAFPYNKWHSTQWALDHSAAFVICSEEFAIRNGASPERLLHPHVALDSSFGASMTRRGAIHRWPTMRIMGEAASAHLGRDLSQIEAVELYSCFPAAVRVQQRELGLDLDGTPTVLGGMPFAGGPFNHFTYMATVALAERLRSGECESALLSTVSGLLTKGGLMVWGREPARKRALVADVAPEAQAATGMVDVDDFDPQRQLEDDDRVLGATVTGGFDPKLFAIAQDRDGVRHIVSAAVDPDAQPVEILSALPR